MLHPSVFSPSMFSPSVFSPSVFSPSVFCPSMFGSEGVLAVDVLAVGVLAVGVLAVGVLTVGVQPVVVLPVRLQRRQAFESAQIRSLIAVSAKTEPPTRHQRRHVEQHRGVLRPRHRTNGEYGPADPFRPHRTRRRQLVTGVDPEHGALLPTTPAPAAGTDAPILADYAADAGTSPDAGSARGAHRDGRPAAGSSTSGPAPRHRPQRSGRRVRRLPVRREPRRRAIRDMIVGYATSIDRRFRHHRR